MTLRPKRVFSSGRSNLAIVQVMMHKVNRVIYSVICLHTPLRAMAVLCMCMCVLAHTHTHTRSYTRTQHFISIQAGYCYMCVVSDCALATIAVLNCSSNFCVRFYMTCRSGVSYPGWVVGLVCDVHRHTIS
jgi:hypothetical protein